MVSRADHRGDPSRVCLSQDLTHIGTPSTAVLPCLPRAVITPVFNREKVGSAPISEHHVSYVNTVVLVNTP